MSVQEQICLSCCMEALMQPTDSVRTRTCLNVSLSCLLQSVESKYIFINLGNHSDNPKSFFLTTDDADELWPFCPISVVWPVKLHLTRVISRARWGKPQTRQELQRPTSSKLQHSVAGQSACRAAQLAKRLAPQAGLTAAQQRAIEKDVSALLHVYCG